MGSEKAIDLREMMKTELIRLGYASVLFLDQTRSMVVSFTDMGNPGGGLSLGEDYYFLSGHTECEVILKHLK